MKNKQIENVWVLINKLRGAFEITDFSKIILYGILLKYVENECSDCSFYDEKYSLGYLSLTYGKMVSNQDVLNYLRKIEDEFGLDLGILSETIDLVLYKADEENVRIIFEKLNGIQLSKEDYYNLAQMVVYRMGTSAGKTSGAFSTNRTLARLETALLDVQEGMTVYDAFCGTGISANEVAAGKGKVYIQDINVGTIGIAAIMTILSNNAIGAIKCADTFYKPIELGAKYDRVVCEPPLGCLYNKDYIVNIPDESLVYGNSSDSRYLALRHTLASVKEDGIAAVLVPMGVLFSSRTTGDIRQRLVDDNYIEAIIEFPAGIMMPYSNVATALILLKKNKTDNKIIMINAKDFFEKKLKTLIISDDNIRRLVEIYYAREVIEGVSNTIALEEIIEKGYNLCTTQYVTLKAEAGIVIEDNAKYIETYDKLLQRLSTIDKELNMIRSRFVKEV